MRLFRKVFWKIAWALFPGWALRRAPVEGTESIVIGENNAVCGESDYVVGDDLVTLGLSEKSPADRPIDGA